MTSSATKAYVAPPGTIPTLEVPDPRSWTSLHLVGIGGAGMSGLARLLLARGISITGSDLKESRTLETLRRDGAEAFAGHRAAQVGRPDAVVVSSAIPPGNPEVAEARRRGIPLYMRAQVLAGLMAERQSIAVSGTHGKTTTTSMISVMLERLGLGPSFVIGGDLNESGSNAGHGRGDLFVAEADESDGSFLLLRPDIGVVTNVEEEHVDFYGGGRDEVEAAFRSFCANCERVVACWDDPGVRRSVAGMSTPIVRYGFGTDADVVVREKESSGGAHGTVEVAGEPVALDLPVRGRHNLLNAAAALGVAAVLGLDLPRAAGALSTFTGVRRRFEDRGHAGGAAFVDDYAHHPTEVAATLETARTNDGRVVAVFQPHRYTRTKAMWRSLGESLGVADVVLITDVYPAGEDPIPGVSGKLLVDALAERQPGKPILYVPRRSEIARLLASRVRPGDLVLTMGAGDITMLGEEIQELIRSRAGTRQPAGHPSRLGSEV